MTGRRLSRCMLAVCAAVASCATMTSSAYGSFGFESLETSFNQAPPVGAPPGTFGPPDFQASSHPYQMMSSFLLNTIANPPTSNNEGIAVIPDGAIKDLQIELPRGVAGNPSAAPQCPFVDLAGGTETFGGACPADTQVGTVTVEGPTIDETVPLDNMVPPAGAPGQFGFEMASPILVNLMVRDSSDYGLNLELRNLPQEVGIWRISMTIWGVPAESSHDPFRGKCLGRHGESNGSCPGDAVAAPLLTMPTTCGEPLITTIAADSWENPGVRVEKSVTTEAAGGASGKLSGCDRLNFTPTVAVQPESSSADSPSGLSIHVGLPYNNDPQALAEADLRSINVALPAGLSVNPPAAAGLIGCSAAQIGIGQATEASCPNESKIGAFEVETPVLARGLRGSIYLAQPAVPFGGVLNIYLVGGKGGLLLKLPGQLDTQPGNGQLTLMLDNIPELPLSGLKLELFGGPRGTIATPPSCGVFTTTSVLAPYSEPESGGPATPSSAFAIDENCAGGFAPSFTAGATSSAAGQSTGFALQVARTDGQQYIQSLTTALPAGLMANLSTIPQCGEAEAAAGTCPASSEVGTITVGAGAGSAPYYLNGRVYLTGPYRGALFGMSMVIAASVGPFDLGTIVVRGEIAVDLSTSSLTIATDAFPAILQGIPLRIKGVDLAIDRPGFMVNPTECTGQRINGTVGSTEGADAALSAPFAVLGCSGLPFTPKLAASTLAKASSRGDGAGIDVKITNAPGIHANLKSMIVQPAETAQTPSDRHPAGVCGSDVRGEPRGVSTGLGGGQGRGRHAAAGHADDRAGVPGLPSGYQVPGSGDGPAGQRPLYPADGLGQHQQRDRQHGVQPAARHPDEPVRTGPARGRPFAAWRE